MSQSMPDTTMIPLLVRTAVLAVTISIAGYLVYMSWNKWQSQGRAKSTIKSTKSAQLSEPHEELLHNYVAMDSQFQTMLDQDEQKLGEIEMHWQEFVKPPTFDDDGQTRAFTSKAEQQAFLNHIPECVVIGPPSFFKLSSKMNAPWRNEMEFIVYDKQADDKKRFIVVHSHFVGEDHPEDQELDPEIQHTDLWTSLKDPFAEDMMVWQVNIRHTLEVKPRSEATVKVHSCDDGWECINGVRNYFFLFFSKVLIFSFSHAHTLFSCHLLVPSYHSFSFQNNNYSWSFLDKSK